MTSRTAGELPVGNLTWLSNSTLVLAAGASDAANEPYWRSDMHPDIRWKGTEPSARLEDRVRRRAFGEEENDE
jgi:hypothetical protein